MSGQDFGPEARARFHQWLEKRYGSIEELNRRWGLEVWSQAYNRFAQIPLPTASVGSVEIPERHHPSLIFAAARFNNDEWSEYIRLQCEAIRKYSDKPITSNMTGTLAMHWYQHNRLLDRAGRSMYKDLKHYHWNLADFDRMRAEKPAPYWLLETAPNWSGGGRLWNIHHDARGVQLMSWMSTLLGGSMTLFWQWREHWAGPEMQHGTHLTATGKWRPNREAWARLANDYREQGPWLLAHPPARAQLALLLSNEAAWAFSIDPIDEGVRYEALWRDDYYLPLARAHLWRDVISEDHDFSSYRVLLCPLMPILKESTRRRLRDWVAKGGRLLLGPLAGYRTEEFTAFTDREFGGLEELIGGTSSIRFTPMWVEETVRVVFTKQAFGDSRGRAERSPTRIWCEGFAPENGKALAHYRGGYGDGHVAALENHPGRGCVITLGAPIRNELYLRLVLRLMKECGLAPLAEGGPDVLVVPRASPEGRLAGYGLANLTKKPQRLALPAGGRDRLTGRRIPRAARLRPLEVLLLETAGRNAGRRTV
jgi:beta-galactosidase GanA